MSAIAERHPLAELPSSLRPSVIEPSHEDCEFVNGNYQEKVIGWESEWIVNRLVWLLMSYCEPRKLGWVNGSNASYQCFAHVLLDDPDRIRKPDVSFIDRDRMTRRTMPTGHCDLVPDLVVEVISPNDLYSEVDDKVSEYLLAGVRLVWVVNPQRKLIHVHRAEGADSTLRGSDELSGEDVVPGFRCSLNDVFQWPEEAAATAT